MPKFENTSVTVQDSALVSFTIFGDVSVKTDADRVTYFISPVTGMEGIPPNDSFGQVEVTIAGQKPKTHKRAHMTRSPWDFTVECIR